MLERRWFAILIGCILGVTFPVQAKILPLLPKKVLLRNHFRISARLIDLRTGRTLAQNEPAAQLIPASVSKLYVAMAALKKWGGDYRFTTRVYYTGTIKHHILNGNLILLGSGDPGFSNAQLWLLARRVREHGIRRIDGKLIINVSHLGYIHCLTSDRCNARFKTHHAYNAPLSAAGFDFSNVCVRVIPGSEAGSPAKITFEPFDLPILKSDGHIQTVDKSDKNTRITRMTMNGNDFFNVSGSVRIHTHPRCHYLAVSNPNRYMAESFRRFLVQNGVNLSDSSDRFVANPVDEKNWHLMCFVMGKSLQTEIKGMLTYSNNYMADMLTLDLARTRFSPPVSLRNGGTWLSRYARFIDQTSSWKAASNLKPILRSGSGLTTNSRVSASSVIALLAYAYHQNAFFPAFLDGLSVPLETPVHMLKTKNQIWMRNIMAKTGSLNNPVSVLNLAGYLRLKNGDWGAFCVLINGTGQHKHFFWKIALRTIENGLLPYLQH